MGENREKTTMMIRPESQKFLQELESYAKMPLVCREEIALLLDQGRSGGKMDVFEDIAFFAKFITKSHDLMKRIGPDGEGYDKVSAEFQSAIEKISTLIRTLIKDGPEDVKQRFTRHYFRMEPDSFAALMRLVRELAWVKNWLLDGHEVP